MLDHCSRARAALTLLWLCALMIAPQARAQDAATMAQLRTLARELLSEPRHPADAADLRYWLENMVVEHGFTPDEVNLATGLTCAAAAAATRELGLEARRPAPRPAGTLLRVLPYPGGRHPRIGFLEGALRPQRETKVSIFTPWDDASYVVADVPEAIFSNLGLIYLAHTHIPTLWDEQGITLPQQEWSRLPEGALESERVLPNGIAFGARVVPTPEGVRMAMWLRNGTDQPLTDMRVQNCVMLKSAGGFTTLDGANRFFRAPYAAVRAAAAPRWIITAWEPSDRLWANERVPCVHSDPRFPDCAPGATVRLHGWLSFYEGEAIESELDRLERNGWRGDGAAGAR